MELGKFIDSIKLSQNIENVDFLTTLQRILAGMADDAERSMLLAALDLDSLQGTEDTSIFLRTQRNRYRAPISRLAARTDEPFLGRFAIWSMAHFAAASVQIFGCHPAHQAMRPAGIHLAVGSLIDCFAGLAAVPKPLGWMPRLAEQQSFANDEAFCREAFQLTRSGGLQIIRNTEDLGHVPVSTIVCSPGMDEAALVTLVNEFLPHCDRFAKIIYFPEDKSAARQIVNEIGDFDGQLILKEKVIGRLFYDWASRTLEVRPLRICMLESLLPRHEIKLARALALRESLGTLIKAGEPAPGVRHELYADELALPTPPPEFVAESQRAAIAAMAEDVKTVIPPTHLSHFSNCRIVAPSAIVFSGDLVYGPSLEGHTAFQNFFHGLYSSEEKDRIIVSKYLHAGIPDAEFVPGRSFHALNISTHNFGHFLSEVFTRMIVLRDIGENQYDHVIVADAFLDWARQGCAILGLDPSKLMPLGNGGKTFEHLTYVNCNHDAYLGVITGNRCNADTFNLPEIEGGERIYLSRLDASHRFILNEQEVIDLVRSKGFEVLTGRGMGLAETIARIRKARIIVGTAGPFAQAITFKHPGTVFIELVSEEFFNMLHNGKWNMPTKDAWHVAHVTGTRLGTVIGPGFSWSDTDEEYMRYMTNFMIKPGDLHEVLDKALRALD
jgi:hypothetical protein